MLGFVIGNNDMVAGFRLVGVEGIEVTSANDAQEALKKVVSRNDIAIIIVSEEFSILPQLREAIDKVRFERVVPMIIELPAIGEKPSKISVSDIVSKTLGVSM